MKKIFYPLVVILLSGFVFSQFGQNRLSVEVIENLKKGHSTTCKVAIQKQSTGLSIGLSNFEIEEYCKCVGAEYFDQFLSADFENLTKTGKLPPRILKRQEQIRNSCWDRSVAAKNEINENVAVKDAVIEKELVRLVADRDVPSLMSEISKQSWSELDLAEALMAAVIANEIDAVDFLLATGANPNKELESWDMSTMEKLGAQNTIGVSGYNTVAMAAREGHTKILRLLLKNGGDPNWNTMYDWNPLHHSMGPGWSHPDAARVLIQFGANVDAVTTLLVTPLHRAAGYCEIEIVEALIKNGAQLDLLDKYGQTAFDRAVRFECPALAEILQ